MTVASVNTGTNRIRGKGRLSPAKTVSFTFDGKAYHALEGDTLASALLANGIHLVGRSFKYHQSTRHSGFWPGGTERPDGHCARQCPANSRMYGRPVRRCLTGCRRSVRTVFHPWNSTSEQSMMRLAGFSPQVFTTRHSCGPTRHG